MIYSFDSLLPSVNSAIGDLSLPKEPQGLYEPIHYELSLGGKRIRPVLCLMACNMFSENTEQALDAAVGIEVFHNFTLMHDDIMDKADIRRGKPTVHNLWNCNTAILSGDAMQILAYQKIAQTRADVLPEVLRLFNQLAIGVCEGQQFDVDFETRKDVTESEYLEMIRLKTAVLIAGSLRIGAVIGGAGELEADSLYQFGQSIGIAFQLRDDLLDVYGDKSIFGKNIGGDIVSNKKTYLLIKALELASSHQLTQLERWLNKKDFRTEEKIAAITELYNQIGVRSLCESLMENYTTEAFRYLEQIPVADERKEPLRKLASELMARVF